MMVARSLVADDPMVLSLLVDDEEFLDDDEDDGVVRMVLDEEGESDILSKGGLGSRLLSQLCLRAMLGVNLSAGSHSKQRRIKSRKRGSLQPLRAICRFLVAGGPRGFPLLLWPPCRRVDPSARVLVTQ